MLKLISLHEKIKGQKFREREKIKGQKFRER